MGEFSGLDFTFPSLAEARAQLILRVGALFRNALAKIHLLVYRLHYCHYLEKC